MNTMNDPPWDKTPAQPAPRRERKAFSMSGPFRLDPVKAHRLVALLMEADATVVEDLQKLAREKREWLADFNSRVVDAVRYQ